MGNGNREPLPAEASMPLDPILRAMLCETGQLTVSSLTISAAPASSSTRRSGLFPDGWTARHAEKQDGKSFWKPTPIYRERKFKRLGAHKC
jgi:hypothetical protein